jgi:ribosome-binding protein aMBF1 (putative translation factor)
MAKKPRLEHVQRIMTDEERARAREIREAAQQEFPPKSVAQPSIPPGIPRQIHDARKRLGITRYQLAQTAKVPSTIVRAIEQGEDVPMSHFEAVATALGLKLELVEQT